jgi:energy-coupling factor transporter transmembrane protein EcfT
MSIAHRLPAGAKLLGLLIAGSTIFLVTDWRWLTVICATVLLL